MHGIKLCYEKKATVPFRISTHPFLFYTIEEICYYFLTNIYLLDPSFQEEIFFRWLDEELRLKKLAAELRETKRSPEECAECILKYMDYCSQEEWIKVKNSLEELKGLTEEEHRCKRADTLLKNRQYHAAILEYKRILRQKDERKNEKVWNNIGVAYSKLFLFQEAANYFKQAYEFHQKDEILKNYLFSCYFLYTEEEYHQFLKSYSLSTEREAEILNEVTNFLTKAKKSVLRREVELLSRYKKDGNFVSYYGGLKKIVQNWKQNYIQETK